MQAAALTEDDARRSSHLVAAADALFDSGFADDAIELVDQAATRAVDPLSRFDAHYLRACMGSWMRSPRHIVEQLLEIADQVEADDPSRASKALNSAAGMAYLAGDLRLGRRHAERAEAIAVAGGDLLEAIVASSGVAWNGFLLGDTDDATPEPYALVPLTVHV